MRQTLLETTMPTSKSDGLSLLTAVRLEYNRRSMLLGRIPGENRCIEECIKSVYLSLWALHTELVRCWNKVQISSTNGKVSQMIRPVEGNRQVR
mmetsp:Transcript_24949/g.47825  ORF Transcript_24949/g.47825 Transcript_24949/m.47825 type:complete len:94 (-) Transcript_24949:544-825(-)